MVAPAYVVRVVGFGLAIGVAVTGCSRAVSVQAPPVSADCEQVLAAAPIRVLEELQRETTPAEAAAVAWGDPPIVLVCGVQVEVAPDAQVIEVNGVEWVAQVVEEGSVFTSFRTAPTIQVRVPAAYRPEAEVLTDLADIVSEGGISSAVS